MAKRLGVNGRKKNAARKVKARGAAKKFVLKTLLIGIIAGSGTLILLGSVKGTRFAIKSIDQSKAFNITDILVQGNYHIESGNILRKCGIEPGQKTYSIKEKTVQAALINDPWIENVKLIKRLSGKIVIKIIERKPIALVNMKSVYYVDKNGVLFPIAKKVISDMPVFCGLSDTVDSKGLRRIRNSDMYRVRDFVKNISDLDENFLQKITQIDFSEKEKIRLSFQAYSTIVEMDQGNINNGLSNLIRLEELLHKNAVMPEKINLCYQNIAFVTVNENMEQKGPVQRIAD